MATVFSLMGQSAPRSTQAGVQQSPVSAPDGAPVVGFGDVLASGIASTTTTLTGTIPYTHAPSKDELPVDALLAETGAGLTLDAGELTALLTPSGNALPVEGQGLPKTVSLQRSSLPSGVTQPSSTSTVDLPAPAANNPVVHQARSFLSEGVAPGTVAEALPSSTSGAVVANVGQMAGRTDSGQIVQPARTGAETTQRPAAPAASEEGVTNSTVSKGSTASSPPVPPSSMSRNKTESSALTGKSTAPSQPVLGNTVSAEATAISDKGNAKSQANLANTDRAENVFSSQKSNASGQLNLLSTEKVESTAISDKSAAAAPAVSASVAKTEKAPLADKGTAAGLTQAQPDLAAMASGAKNGGLAPLNPLPSLNQRRDDGAVSPRVGPSASELNPAAVERRAEVATGQFISSRQTAQNKSNPPAQTAASTLTALSASPGSRTANPSKQASTPPVGHSAIGKAYQPMTQVSATALRGSAIDAGFNAESANLDIDVDPGKNVIGQSTTASLQAAKAAPQLHIAQHINQSPGWEQAMAGRIVWMGNQGLQSANLTLNPQDLGAIQIKVDIAGDQANVQFQAQSAETCDLIEKLMPRLSQALEGQGIKLEDSRVSQFSSSQDFSGTQQQATNQSSGRQNGDGTQRGTAGQPNSAQGSQEPSGESTPTVVVDSAQGVDYYA